MRQEKYHIIIRTAAALSVFLGCLVLSGWLFDVEIFKSMIIGQPPMKFNTAICFILAGVSLFLLLRTGRTSLIIQTCLLAFLLIIGLVSLSENLFQYDSGLDLLFFQNAKSSLPGSARMASATSISFILISIAFFLVKNNSVTARLTSQIFLHCVSVISTIVIIGYLYKVPAFYKLFLLSSVAIHTGIMFFLLSVAASFFNSNRGITGLFTGREIGNQMARDIFPYLLVLILVSGFLRLQFFRTHEAAIEFGIAIVTTSFILISLLIIALTARQLNKINRQRLQAEESLKFMDLTVQDITEQNKFQEQKKKEIMDAIINAQEKERYEISHELHDNVSQVLTTCKLLMESAAKEHDSKFIQLSCEHLQLAIDEIRNLSHQLNPATLKHIGLEGSINDLIDAVNKTRKIRIDLSFGIEEAEKLRSDIQLALFRIIQEQINNILKHSDAKKASVVLVIENGHVKLIIKDDGKGHDFALQKHGLGLRNIFNRAEFHKGNAKIFSEPDKGFELIIMIPAKTEMAND